MAPKPEKLNSISTKLLPLEEQHLVPQISVFCCHWILTLDPLPDNNLVIVFLVVIHGFNQENGNPKLVGLFNLFIINSMH